MHWGCSRTTISRVHCEYRESRRNIKSPTLLRQEKDPAKTGPTMTEENRLT